LSLAHRLCNENILLQSGRFNSEVSLKNCEYVVDNHGAMNLVLRDHKNISISQWDIRELQKAKAAINAAFSILLNKLSLQPSDLHKVYLTGSFGGSVDIDAALGIGLLPVVEPDVIENSPNGAGFGAAVFLTNEGFLLGERTAMQAEQVDLDQVPEFMDLYIESMRFNSGIPVD
jgi:uncharacterized 2Fe-2S/4Fe-4S cluster protein (DUF4445 family)